MQYSESSPWSSSCLPEGVSPTERITLKDQRGRKHPPARLIGASPVRTRPLLGNVIMQSAGLGRGRRGSGLPRLVVVSYLGNLYGQHLPSPLLLPVPRRTLRAPLDTCGGDLAGSGGGVLPLPPRLLPLPMVRIPAWPSVGGVLRCHGRVLPALPVQARLRSGAAPANQVGSVRNNDGDGDSASGDVLIPAAGSYSRYPHVGPAHGPLPGSAPHPHIDRRCDFALQLVGHRPRHQPHPRLRRPDGERRTPLRARGGWPGGALAGAWKPDHLAACYGTRGRPLPAPSREASALGEQADVRRARRPLRGALAPGISPRVYARPGRRAARRRRNGEGGVEAAIRGDSAQEGDRVRNRGGRRGSGGSPA